VNHDSNPVQIRHISSAQLQSRLIAELDDLFVEIEDGIVKENSFTTCIALGHKSLPPLNENQSRQIKEALFYKPGVALQLVETGPSILDAVFNFIRSLLGSGDKDINPEHGGAESNNMLLDQYGRVKSRDAVLDHSGQDIQEKDVETFFKSHGKDNAWVLPYSWDIANRLNSVKRAEVDGDLALFFERRRKLNVQRPKATCFEKSVQRYAAKVSELYSDEKGNITDERSLEMFVHDLVEKLLKKTKNYWPISPLLAIFDGVVATVLRPLLHRHRTVYFQNDMTTEAGVIVSGNTMAKSEQLVTTPKWNEEAQKSVARYVKKAIEAQVWSLFMDRYAPFNRDYSKSPHVDASKLSDAGLLVKSFGDPVHLDKVMELLQSTNQADDLVGYVSDHFRNDDIIDH